MKFKALIALSLLTSTCFAEEFTPPTNYSLHYDSATITTDAGFEATANIFSFAINNYYTNNISTKFFVGMGAGDQEATVNGADTRDKLRVNYLVSADARYEIPITNSLAAYVLAGASFVDTETTQDVLNESRTDFGFKAGFGMSWAIGDNTALYAEVNQNLYKSDFEIQSFSAGFKFTY